MNRCRLTPLLGVGFQEPHQLCALCKATDSELIDQAFVREYGIILSNLVNYFQIFGFPAAIIALILGWCQLQSAARTSRVQMLLALDTRLSDFEDVRAKINELDPDIDNVRLRRYIAVFERVGLALRYKQITSEEVHRFYGQRFVNLMRLQETREIVANREGWTDFYYLWEKLRGYDGYDEKLPKL